MLTTWFFTGLSCKLLHHLCMALHRTTEYYIAFNKVNMASTNVENLPQTWPRYRISGQSNRQIMSNHSLLSVSGTGIDQSIRNNVKLIGGIHKVSTHLRNLSQVGSFPQLGVKLKMFETTTKSTIYYLPSVLQRSLYHQPKQSIVMRKILQNDHTFALFDPPKNWVILMIPVLHWLTWQWNIHLQMVHFQEAMFRLPECI